MDMEEYAFAHEHTDTMYTFFFPKWRVSDSITVVESIVCHCTSNTLDWSANNELKNVIKLLEWVKRLFL